MAQNAAQVAGRDGRGQARRVRQRWGWERVGQGPERSPRQGGRRGWTRLVVAGGGEAPVGPLVVRGKP